MGNSYTNKYKVIVGGLSSSGKTTIINRIKRGEHIQTTPSLGISADQVIIDGNQVSLWDFGSAYRTKSYLEQYLIGSHGLIYVIDLSDEYWVQSSINELKDKYLSCIEDIPILILGNKCDSHSIQIDKIKILLNQNTKGRRINFAPCIGLTGAGINQGMKWLVKEMKNVKL